MAKFSYKTEQSESVTRDASQPLIAAAKIVSALLGHKVVASETGPENTQTTLNREPIRSPRR